MSGIKESQGQDGSSCVGVRAPDVGIGFQKGGGGTLSGEGGSDQAPEPET